MPNARARLKLALTIATCGTLCIGAPVHSVAAGFQGVPKISDLHPLNVPRASVSIGSQWQQNVGPISGGLPEDSLEVVRGISESSLRRSTVLHVGIVAGLLQRIKLKASARRRVASTVTIDSATIARVRDMDQLDGAATGVSFVWEGLKVHGFTFDDTLGLEAELNASLPAGSKVVSVDVGGSNSRRYSVKGADLYVAYRVVSFEPPRLESLGDTELRADDASKDIGAAYTVTFVDNPGDGTCSGRLRVIDHTNRRARPTNVPVVCGTRTNGRYNLGVRPIAAGFGADELVYSKLKRETRDGEAGIRARVEIKRRIYAIRTEPSPVAPGW